MKLNKIFSKRTAYIMLFGILYLAVAFTSTLHAIQFFGLTNENYLSVVLAIAFEIGQAAVLLSLLTTKGERGKITPWVLMCIFTLVQIIGNVFSSYKYAVLHSIGNLRFFKEPIFVWTSNISDNVANVIVTYISSSILPIAALLLTSMIANYITDSDESLDTPVNELEATKHKQSTPITSVDETQKPKIVENTVYNTPTAGVLDNTLIEDDKPVEGEETVFNEVEDIPEDNEDKSEIGEDKSEIGEDIKVNEPIPVVPVKDNSNISYIPKESENISSISVPVDKQIICNTPENTAENTAENPIDFETSRQQEQIKKSGFVNL